MSPSYCLYLVWKQHCHEFLLMYSQIFPNLGCSNCVGTHSLRPTTNRYSWSFARCFFLSLLYSIFEKLYLEKSVSNSYFTNYRTFHTIQLGQWDISSKQGLPPFFFLCDFKISCERIFCQKVELTREWNSGHLLSCPTTGCPPFKTLPTMNPYVNDYNKLRHIQLSTFWNKLTSYFHPRTEIVERTYPTAYSWLLWVHNVFSGLTMSALKIIQVSLIKGKRTDRKSRYRTKCGSLSTPSACSLCQVTRDGP